MRKVAIEQLFLLILNNNNKRDEEMCTGSIQKGVIGDLLSFSSNLYEKCFQMSQ